MDLIIDANIVISVIISLQGKTSELLFYENIHLFAPEYLLQEFNEHKKEILQKSKLGSEDLELALSLIYTRIEFIPFSDFERYISSAKKISPDPEDVEYFALALKFGFPIWSNDKLLKEQKQVLIYSTKELLEKFGA